jgi:viroplasmin and RNaseH domain-containing protein
MPVVWVYQGKELKVFASEEAAQKWFDENDPEGVAVKCEVEGEEALEPISSVAPGC